MELRRVRLTDPLVAPLIADMTREYDLRYGKNDEMSTVDAADFDPPSGTFVVLIDGGEVLAGGGLRRVAGDTCEVKRMWTAPGQRRKGYASRVLTALEDAARAAGYSTLLLETGPFQPEAIALYTGRGYRRIPTYGRYPDALAFRFALRSSVSHPPRSGERMDYTGLVKNLDLPAGVTPPRELSYQDTRATALTRDDLDDDVRGINASLDLIRSTRGGGWPTEPVTAADNYVDLVWHELEFRERISFAYVVRRDDGEYLGCCYLYPMGRRVALTEDLMRHDVDVSWWVTTDAYERGYYVKVYEALIRWLDTELPFTNPYFSNVDVPGPDRLSRSQP
jgi:GNAT superfamily N-acetyltransferase